jgi:circadian clock protein KaiC
MSSKRKLDVAPEKLFPKARSGIRGLDEITFGGLPKGRPTLIAGGPGSGKTLMSMEFLVRGATDYGEPGLFMAFEETLTNSLKTLLL